MNCILDRSTDPPSVVEEPDLLAWAISFEGSDRSVGFAERDGVRVSTVFLGIDHSHADGPPVLFKTTIFGGANDGYEERYTSWEGAVAGHLVATLLGNTWNN